MRGIYDEQSNTLTVKNVKKFVRRAAAKYPLFEFLPRKNRPLGPELCAISTVRLDNQCRQIQDPYKDKVSVGFGNMDVRVELIIDKTSNPVISYQDVQVIRGSVE